MKRSMITRKKFYDIRRLYKRIITGGGSVNSTRKTLELVCYVSPSTITKVLQSRNFREYKASGNVYGKGVKVLRKRYLFILGVLVVVLLLLNLK